MSGRLVRDDNGEIQVAYDSVYAPGYTMLVSDGLSGNGWTYYADEVQPVNFVARWVAVDEGYPMGESRTRNGITWMNQVEGNVREPGESGWVEATAIVPVWVQPLGAHDAYPIDTVVQHNGKFWIALVDANVWEPPVNWRETMIDPNAPPAQWVQPTGAGDAYPLGARVSHNGQVWTSIEANNVWEPGVFGWVAD